MLTSGRGVVFSVTIPQSAESADSSLCTREPISAHNSICGFDIARDYMVYPKTVISFVSAFSAGRNLTVLVSFGIREK